MWPSPAVSTAAWGATWRDSSSGWPLEVLHERIPDYRPDPEQTPGYNNIAIRTVDPLPLVFTAP